MSAVHLGMASFDLKSFLIRPSVKQLDQCRKEDLVEIAQHFSLTGVRQLLKADLKAVIVDELVERGNLVLPAMSDAVPEDWETQKLEAEPSAAQGEGGDSEDNGRFTPPLAFPRHEALSPGGSVGSREGANLKVRLARLQLEATDKEQSRQMQFQLEVRKLEIETVIISANL